jgi:transcription elongation factor Elf1
VNKQHKRQQCQITKPVQIICPVCHGTVTVPMYKAVNGEKIVCNHCHAEFEFRIPQSL